MSQLLPPLLCSNTSASIEIGVKILAVFIVKGKPKEDILSFGFPILTSTNPH